MAVEINRQLIALVQTPSLLILHVKAEFYSDSSVECTGSFINSAVLRVVEYFGGR